MQIPTDLKMGDKINFVLDAWDHTWVIKVKFFGTHAYIRVDFVFISIILQMTVLTPKWTVQASRHQKTSKFVNK